MEEIYNKMNEMIELGKNQEELSKQTIGNYAKLFNKTDIRKK